MQRQFDVENAEDMALLWSILPDDVVELTSATKIWITQDSMYFNISAFNIDWHGKTKITRPIQEATEADIGKLCGFWNEGITYIGKLCHMKDTDTGKYYEMGAPVVGNFRFTHCRRLTKQEAEELI